MKGLGMGVIKWQLGRRDATPEIAGPLRKVSERGEPEVDPLEELIRLVGEADADNVRPQDNAGRSPAMSDRTDPPSNLPRMRRAGPRRPRERH